MIVRVQGSGQYRLADSEVEALKGFDHQLVDAVHARDQILVHQLLDEMIALVQGKGQPLEIHELLESETVLPHDTITLEEVESLLLHESLVGTANAAS
jgi:hypothetical protein